MPVSYRTNVRRSSEISLRNKETRFAYQARPICTCAPSDASRTIPPLTSQTRPAFHPRTAPAPDARARKHSRTSPNINSTEQVPLRIVEIDEVLPGSATRTCRVAPSAINAVRVAQHDPARLRLVTRHVSQRMRAKSSQSITIDPTRTHTPPNAQHAYGLFTAARRARPE